MIRRVAAHPPLPATRVAVLIACAWLGAIAAWAQAPPPADEPTFTISAVRTFKGSTNERTETSREFELCDTWSRGMFGFGGPRWLYHHRGSLLGLKPGEVLLFRERAGKGSGSSENPAGETPLKATMVFVPGQGEEVSCPGPEMQSRGPDQADALIRRTEHGAILEFDCSVAALDCEDAFGMLGSCVADGPGWEGNYSRFVLSDEDLRSWSRIDKVIRNAGPVPRKENGAYETYEARLTVSPGRPDETEVSVEPEPAYATWLPKGNLQKPGAAGNTLKVHIRAYKKGNPLATRRVTLRLNIVDDSIQKGLCINWPPSEAKADDGVRIRPADNPGLDFSTPGEARTRSEVEQLDVILTAFDYGAWGTMRIKAKDQNGRDARVKVCGLATSDLLVPMDENRNHIADAWERTNKVYGLPANWDDAAIPGQIARGDGLTLYEKYRGVVVQGPSGAVYMRLNPHEKVHFVLDSSSVLDIGRWYRSTGIRTYLVRDSMVDSNRQVDRYGGAMGNGGKYAVRIEVIKGLSDPHLPKDKDSPTQYAYTQGTPGPSHWTPGTTVACRILPDRIGAVVDRRIAAMKRALSSPATKEDREELQLLQGVAAKMGMTMDEVRRVVNNFDVHAREARVSQMVALSAVHEMGHACGVNGHLDANGDEDENSVRNPSCPSQYLDQAGRRRWILTGELHGDGTFCKVAPDLCWRDINVKH